MEPKTVEVLKMDNNYRIETEYPYNIYKIKKDGSKGKYLKESERNPGSYPRIVLSGKDYNKHMVLAEQFIPKPDTDQPLEVDHINNDKKDYHIENLRWVTHKVNCINKKGYGKIDYEYFDTLPEDCKTLHIFNGSHFVDYYYDTNLNMYLFNGLRYRKLHILKTKTGTEHYDCRDNTGKIKRISLNYLQKLNVSPQPVTPQITD